MRTIHAEGFTLNAFIDEALKWGYLLMAFMIYLMACMRT